MDSPSAQLVEPSFLIDCDGPPSSPFLTEVDTTSRNPSTAWKPDMDSHREVDMLSSTVKSGFVSIEEDKENMPQTPSIKNKPSTPLQEGQDVKTPETKPKGLFDSESMLPPPSTMRKSRLSPRKSPLKSSQGSTKTPKTASKTNPDDEKNSAFQAGLEQRERDVSTPEPVGSIDDTCFTAFSEIPEMTLFSKIGQSPTRRIDTAQTARGNPELTPRTTRKRSSPSRSPSPTPRRAKVLSTESDGTTFLIDFTQQFDAIPARRHLSPAKSTTEPNLLRYLNDQRSPAKSCRQSFATPSKPSAILNLLDFDLPPAPTPRSVPTITVRELESLKSGYMSQISGLKANLSGREAEVESLKRAVGDAERRVGDAQEALREEKCKREHAEEEKAGWERRGHEVENVLKSVKEEVMKSESEKDEMARKIEEYESRIEEAENRAMKAEERFADTLVARANTADGEATPTEEVVERLVAAQIDSKIEAVSRELHSVYKEKHERKVATLKKSYEARSEKKCAELQSRLSQLEKQHDELLLARDATFSGPVPDTSTIDASVNVELKAQIGEQQAALARLEKELHTSRQQQDQLAHELQQERIEKGDLVAAVDEMLALQSQAPPGPPQAAALSVVEDFRKSISRPTGLKTPRTTAPESKIGRSMQQPSSVSNLIRSTSGPAGKSRMLANIERMGRMGSGNGSEGA